MSVQWNTYVIYGVKLPYKKWGNDNFFEKYEEYLDSAFDTLINPKDDLTLLYDGMSGEYIIFGHVIDKTATYQGFEEVIDISNIKKKKKWKKALEKVLDMEIKKEDMKLFVVTHYR